MDLSGEEIGALLFAARACRSKTVRGTVSLMRKFGEDADLTRQEARLDALDSAIAKLRKMKEEVE